MAGVAGECSLLFQVPSEFMYGHVCWYLADCESRQALLAHRLSTPCLIESLLVVRGLFLTRIGLRPCHFLPLLRLTRMHQVVLLHHLVCLHHLHLLCRGL